MTLTTQEAAERFGITPQQIWQWVSRGRLKPVRPGAKPLRFLEEDVAEVEYRCRDAGQRVRIEEARTRMANERLES